MSDRPSCFGGYEQSEEDCSVCPAREVCASHTRAMQRSGDAWFFDQADTRLRDLGLDAFVDRSFRPRHPPNNRGAYVTVTMWVQDDRPAEVIPLKGPRP